MHPAKYYREQAAHARRLSGMVHQDELRESFKRLADDYDDIAADLENGVVEIRHPERLPQWKRSR
jgi:HSP20 family molecular chaperone IbpA